MVFKYWMSRKSEVLNYMFEITNGIIGVNRDITFQLINLMIFRQVDMIRNFVGISGVCVDWLNHPYFIYVRNDFSKLNLKKLIKRNSILEEKKLIEINIRNVKFNFFNEHGSLFMDILIKKMIFKCTIRIEYNNFRPIIYLGASTPSQLNNAMKNCIGWLECGAGLCFDRHFQIGCNMSWSRLLREEDLRNGEVMKVLLEMRDDKNHLNLNCGRLSFFRDEKRIPHIITSLPFTGVHFGFSVYNSTITFHILSFLQLRAPPVYSKNDSMRCIKYNFNGGFNRFMMVDEEEKEISVTQMNRYYLNE